MAEFQQTLEEDRANRDLQISTRGRQLRQQQERVRPPPSSEEVPPSAVDVSRLWWEEVKDAPVVIRKGTAVVDGNTVYINPWSSLNMYSCQVISSQEQQWSTLPDLQLGYSSLVVIDGMLTSVGSVRDCKWTNSLFSLTGGTMWSEVFPAMPTPRQATCWLLAGETTREEPLLQFIATKITPTRGVSCQR